MPALVLGAVLLATAARYGFHGDELYFRMLPPARWYDDQPPITVWLSHVTAMLSDDVWVQRVPAIAAACVGVFVASAFVRIAGHGRDVQRVAAWAHAFTVYPLLMGHVFLTASLDLLVWQLVLLGAVAALRGHRHALAWAGLAAGVGCWNKLLVVVLVGAVVVGLFVCDRRRLATRDALLGGLAFAVIGAPQALAQLCHGMPMTRVSADLVAQHGTLFRWLVVPLLVVFLGPPFAPVWWRGLRWRPDGGCEAHPGALHERRSGASILVQERRASGGGDPPGSARAERRVGPPFLLVVGLVVLVWNLVVPGQPYYAIAAFLPALALGWGALAQEGAKLWRKARVVVASNAVVAAVLCLPIVPTSSPLFVGVAALDPVARDQVGWPGLVIRCLASSSTFTC